MNHSYQTKTSKLTQTHDSNLLTSPSVFMYMHKYQNFWKWNFIWMRFSAYIRICIYIETLSKKYSRDKQTMFLKLCFSCFLIMFCGDTYQQLSFLIDAKSDCLDRAITISSVRRVIIIVWSFVNREFNWIFRKFLQFELCHWCFFFVFLYYSLSIMHWFFYINFYVAQIDTEKFWNNIECSS